MSEQTTASGRRAMRIAAMVMLAAAAAALLWNLYGLSQGREMATPMVVMTPILAVVAVLLLNKTRTKA